MAEDRRNIEIGNIREELGKLKGWQEANAASIYQIQQDQKHHRAEVDTEISEFKIEIKKIIQDSFAGIREDLKAIGKSNGWLTKIVYTGIGGGGSAGFIIIYLDKIKTFIGH